MRKYLIIFSIIASLFQANVYALAGSCCLKDKCECVKGACCNDGKGSCKAGCCVKGACQCGDVGCKGCNCNK